MAETYLCHGEEIHFSNGSVELLQNIWIEIGKKLENQNGVDELVRKIEEHNSYGQGFRAMDIVESHKDFESVIPLIRWYEINEIILTELKSIGGKSRIFTSSPSQEIVKDRIRKINVILKSLNIEIKLKKASDR